MEEIVRKDILAVLHDSALAFEKSETLDLKKISDYSLHNSTTFQDEDSISIAILIYSLAKICERTKPEDGSPLDPLKSNIIKRMRKARFLLEKNKDRRYRKVIKSIFELVKRKEKNFITYANHVINQAKIKKGSRITEHGLSIGRVSELLGITKWDLMNFMGQTKIYDKEMIRTKTVTQRLAVAKKLFRRGLLKK